MTKRVIHVVHPGWVRSINDRDRHFIGFASLARLYGLAPSADVVDAGRVSTAWEQDPAVEVRHYYPRPAGDYR